MRAALPIAAHGGSRSTSTWFTRAAGPTAAICGRPAAFLAAAAVVVSWAILGPMFHYSDTWQLVINTGTTIVTFLMVFLIQSTQNRDTAALQLKLDELIVATQAAHNTLAGIEEASEEELRAAKEDVRKRSDASAK
ncbi:MAG: low affinity iron permease family protein [Casimicrobiaceae bacterium]